MATTCPEPETMARIAEGVADQAEREAVVEHAADCVACRRHLAIVAMPPFPEPKAAEPIRPGRVFGALWSVAAAAMAAAAFWYAITIMRPPAPTPPVVEQPPPAPKTEDVVDAPSEPRRDWPPLPLKKRPPPPPPRPKQKPIETPAPEPEIVPPVEEPPPAPETAPEEYKPIVPAEPTPPTETVPTEWKPLDGGTHARVALRDPFGSLWLRQKDAPSSAEIDGAGILPVDATLLAGSRPGGATLADGTRVQLAAGAAAALSRSGAFACLAVRLDRGTMLIDLPDNARLYVTRGETTVLVEGASGPVLLNAGPRANVLEMASLKSAAACRLGGDERVEVSSSDVLVFERGQSRRSARNGRAKDALGRFVAWPDKPVTSLLLTFEPDQDEAVGVRTGEMREGYVASSRQDRKKVIELTLGAAMARDAHLLRLRFRTMGHRIVASARGDTGAGPITIAVHARNRSEHDWAEVSAVFEVPRDVRTLSFYVDVPSRVADVDKFVFDIDEIELTRRQSK